MIDLCLLLPDQSCSRRIKNRYLDVILDETSVIQRGER
jgi:hypothetical protein